jgi:hypothetical protein
MPFPQVYLLIAPQDIYIHEIFHDKNHRPEEYGHASNFSLYFSA